MSNLFRIPLNILVVTTLLYVGSLPVDVILSFCGESWLATTQSISLHDNARPTLLVCRGYA